MDFENPDFLFVLVDGRLVPRLFPFFYRRYADTIELKGDESVLDFGAGSGGLALHLAPRLKDGGSVTCLDICPPFIRIAEKRLRRYPNVKCLLGRIETLDLDPASFDRIVVHNALHDIPAGERKDTVAELARVLKVGGKIHLREPTKPSHGMAPDEVRALMNGVGLSEERSSEYKRFPLGPVVEAVFVKMG
jgi:ubiquinone/menaquinone biosynthesis C-methylase UbiE